MEEKSFSCIALVVRGELLVVLVPQAFIVESASRMRSLT